MPLFLLLCFHAGSQTNQCNNNAGGEITVSSSCNFMWFDVATNNDYWDAANGCGASDVDAVWGWFVAASTSTTIIYDPIGGGDPIITVFSAACSTGMPYTSCMNAGGNNTTETLTFPTTIGATYHVRIENQGSNSDMTGDLCAYNAVPPPPAANATCVSPSPICSGSPISFVANEGEPDAEIVNPGNNYDCLFTSPNPSWYYLEIDQGGNLVIDITAGSDVDYAIWGPFPNLANAQASCNSYAVPEDCSYSISAIEQAVVNGVASGEVYVLLVTNYANTVQTINIDEAGSNTASTNCGIVPLPVGYSHWDLVYADGHVRLVWATETEQENKHFAIQRSADGLIWETIGMVAGKGTTEEDQYYHFTDSEPLNGISYYRLLQVDINGTPSYTSVLSVNSAKVEHLTIYPNPAKNNFNILLKEHEIEQLILTDLVGKAYPANYTESAIGLEVNCSDLSPGMYTLTVVAHGVAQSERLIIQE